MNENTPSAGLRFDKAEAYCPVEPSHDAIGRRGASSRRGRPQNATARLSRFDEADCSQEDRQVAEGNNVARHTYATLALFAKQIGGMPRPSSLDLSGHGIISCTIKPLRKNSDAFGQLPRNSGANRLCVNSKILILGPCSSRLSDDLELCRAAAFQRRHQGKGASHRPIVA